MAHPPNDLELHGHFLRQYNLILEMLAQLQKFAPHVERLSIDAATHARALYDLLPIVETKLDQSHSNHRVFLGDHATAIEKKIDQFLDAARRDREAIVEHIIAIRTATALAANDAGDAKDAANAAREDTGRFRLLDAHGHPTHTPEVGGHAKKDTPEDQKGVAGAVVKGLGVWGKMGARPQLLLIVLALIGLAALAFKGGQWHAKPPEPPRIEHREPRQIEPPREHRRETP